MVTDCVCEKDFYMACELGPAAACEQNPSEHIFECVACPVGSSCTGDSNEIDTEDGYWQPPATPGSLEATIQLVLVIDESEDEQFKEAFSDAMEIVTGTGNESITVQTLESQGPLLSVAFTVSIPEGMSTGAVSGAINSSVALRRSLTSFTSLLATNLADVGVNVTGSITANGYVVENIREPAYSAAVLQCPYPNNCIPAPNRTCALGATGVLCGLCEVGWALKADGCEICEAAGSWGPLIALGAMLAVILVMVLIQKICGRMYPSEDNDAKEEDAEASDEGSGVFTLEAEDATAFHSDISLDRGHNAKVGQVQQLGAKAGIDVKNLGVSTTAQSTASAGSLVSSLVNKIKQAYATITAPAKIVVTYLQIVSSFTVSFAVPWPAVFTNYSQFFSFINLDAMRTVDIQCMASDYTFLDTFMVSITTPLGFIALAVVMWILRRFYLVATETAEELENALRLNQNFFIKLIIFMLYLIYPGVSATILQVFKCTEVVGVWFLTADQRVQCFDDNWNSYAMIAVLAVIIFPIGIPLLFAGTLSLAHYRGELFEDKPLMEEGDSLEATIHELAVELRTTCHGAQRTWLDEKRQHAIEEELRMAQGDLATVEKTLHTQKLMRDRLGFLYSSYDNEAYLWEVSIFV